MKIVSSTPAPAKPSMYAASVEDRTFTLSPQAYAIIQHMAEGFDGDTATALEAAVLTIDALRMELGLSAPTVVIHDDGTTTYSLALKPVATPTELKGV